MPNKSGITIYVHKRTGPLRGPPFRRSAIPGVRVRFRVNPIADLRNGGPESTTNAVYYHKTLLTKALLIGW